MSLIEYHKTTTKELITVTNKVRNLITHWGEDGRYKEAVLKNVIKRFLPEKYLIGTGFVIKPTAVRGEHISSRQIDLIIYDDESPVLFKEGDFVIMTPDSVRGIVEVKANLQNQPINEVVRQANENGEFIFSAKVNKAKPFFNGIFSFEGFHNLNAQTFQDHINQGNDPFRLRNFYTQFKVNHVSLNKDWFLKYWPEEASPHSLYHIEDLSFSFFISNLVDTLATTTVTRNSFIWFAHDKELNLDRSF